MDVVIYARFSSHNQNEQSIEGQVKICREYALRNGYQVTKEYIDRALSGTNDNRPEFQKMIEDSNRKQFKGIIVYQLDRFARNRYDSAVYKAKLKKNGVRVYSARENISEDASGVLMEGILESMAEYYSTELSQKIKRGMRLNAEKGLCTGGNIALGYKIDDSKRFVIDDLTSPTVIKVFKMYSSGNKISEIIDHLNSQGIRTSRGVQFNKNSISKMLRNKRYIGIYTFNGVEVSNSIPRIIEDDLFLEVQEKLIMNKKSPGRARAKNEYLLTTKLFCGKCNAMMTGISGTSMTGKKHQYYVCNNAKVKKCDKHSIKKEFIENEVIDQCRALLTDVNIDLISKEVVKLIDKEEKENSVLKSLNRQLNDNQKAMDNLLRAIENGQAVDLITERLQDKKLERDNLKKQIELENRSIRKIAIPEIKFFLNQLKNGDINELKYRRSLISIFVSSIYLYDDKVEMILSIDGNKSKGVKPEIDYDYLNDSSSVECVAPPKCKTTAVRRFLFALNINYLPGIQSLF